MPHPENLVPCTPENAAERGRKGGAVKSDAQKWKNQKYCNKNCVFIDRCPAISSSKTLPPVIKNNKDNYPCFIKMQPREVQNYFVNLFVQGEEGLIKLILDLHFRLLLKVGKEASVKVLKEAIETTLLMKKGIYGDTQKVEHSGEVGVSIIDDIPRKKRLDECPDKPVDCQ